MRPFIVAEMSANHLGDFNRALKLVDAAAEAGADAVKLQTFEPERMAVPGEMVESGPWAGRELIELYREAHTPKSWHRPLFDRAKERGIEAFSSVFSVGDLEFLEALNCPRYKIASFELVDLNLILAVGATEKPMIISTGMAGLSDILDAAAAARIGGCNDLTLLKCTSGYPAPVREANLAALGNLKIAALGSGIGYSDHTLSIGTCAAAAALGASVIEAHLTLSRADGGPDAGFSYEPHEFNAMVKACRDAAEAIGTTHFGPTESEQPQVHIRGRTLRAKAE